MFFPLYLHVFKRRHFLFLEIFYKEINDYVLKFGATKETSPLIREARKNMTKINVYKRNLNSLG